MTDSVKISVVIPVLNENLNILQLYGEVVAELNRLVNQYEIIFVDDGSTDNSFKTIKQIAELDPCASGISLSRNFGHQIALLAGLRLTTGEVVITMDGDFQHPPTYIKRLYGRYKEGYDIVNARRINTTRDGGFFKRKSSALYYRLLNKLLDINIRIGSADFRLMNRQAVDAFLAFPERDRFTRGLVSWLGFRQSVIDYDEPRRRYGYSKYSIHRMLRLGIDGITSFSSKPLRLSFYAGFIVFLLGIVYAVYALLAYFRGDTISGWTSLLVCILILGGFQLLTIGIVGEYIARIFNETKARPLYFVKDKT